MDLLFKRYASPFLFMDGMIQTGRFSEFVSEFVALHNEDYEFQLDWDIYLHKVQGITFEEFKAEIETNKQLQEMTENTIESTVQNSLEILNNFKPSEGGET